MSSISAPGLRPGEGGYRRVLIAFFCAGLGTWALLFDAQAVLPAIAVDFGVQASTAALAVSLTTLGLAIGVLPWSALSDRLGRSRAMQISIVATASISALSVFAPTLETFLAIRLLLGLTLAGLPAVSMAYLSEEIEPRYLAQTAGIFVAGNTIGGMLGRIVASPVGELAGWRTGIGTVSAIGIVASVVFVLLIPAARTANGSLRDREERGALGARILVNLRDPRIRVLYALGFIVLGTFTAIYNYLAFRLTHELGVTPTIASVLFLGLSLGTVGSVLAGRLAGPWGRRRTVLVGFGIAGAGVVLLFVPVVAVVFVGLGLSTLGIFVVNTVVYGWVGQHSTVGKAQATAMFQLFTQTGNALIGWGAGVIYGYYGWAATVVALLLVLGVGATLAITGLPKADAQRERSTRTSGPIPTAPASPK